jgi:hypothetical protein
MTHPNEPSQNELPMKNEQTLVEFFRNSTLVEAELNLEREVDYGRDIDL